MENVKETYNRSNETHNANDTAHYRLLAIGIFVAILGVVVRFFGTFDLIDVLANIILIVGTVLCLRAVYNILK